VIDTLGVEVLFTTGDYPFGNVESVELLEGGGLAVADVQADHVAIFNERGELVDTIGGEGDGPGELSGVVAVTQLPDGTLATVSHGHRRVTLFEGEPVTYRVAVQMLSPTVGAGPKLYGRLFDTTVDPPAWGLRGTDLKDAAEPVGRFVAVELLPASDLVEKADGSESFHPYHLGERTFHVNRHGEYVYLDQDTSVVVGNLDSAQTARLPRPAWTPIEQDMDVVERAYEIIGADPPTSLGRQLPVIILAVFRDDQGRVWFGRTARIQSITGDPLTTMVWDPETDRFTTVVFPPFTNMTDRYPFRVRGDRAAVVSIDEYGRQTVHVVRLPYL
jgi:hypothetical protein